MRTNNRFMAWKPAAFSRTDLIVLIGVFAVVIALLILGIPIGMERYRRAQCRADLRQIGIAFQLYAQDSGGLLPDCTRNNPKFAGSVWPWDVNTNLVAELEKRGAKRDSLYCPSNAGMNDERHWDFPKFTRARTRVLGYVFLFNGCRDVPPWLARTNLNGDGSRKPSEVELTADATVNQGGDYAHIRGSYTDRSSHLSGQNPAGGNILFEDGHASWRPFGQMKHEIIAQVVWDF